MKLFSPAGAQERCTMCGPSIDTDGRVQQRFARCGVTQGFLPQAFRLCNAASSGKFTPTWPEDWAT